MKKFVIVLLTFAVAIGAYYFKMGKKNPPQTIQKQENQLKVEVQNSTSTPLSKAVASTTTDNAKPMKTYTMTEVAAHGADPNSEECWTVIHGKVYNILDFATNSHPGGEVIFDACGKDATKLFETRPSGSKTPHSAEARKILEKYYIGDLKK